MVIEVAHLTLSAVWLGSTVYSLGVVQPRVDRFFPGERDREDFLLVLAQGNRWRVAPLIALLVLSSLFLLVTTGVMGYAVPLVLYLAAGAVFWNVSWRHWPARAFALTEELAGYQRRLRGQAWAMLALVGTAFVVALILK